MCGLKQTRQYDFSVHEKQKVIVVRSIPKYYFICIHVYVHVLRTYINSLFYRSFRSVRLFLWFMQTRNCDDQATATQCKMKIDRLGCVRKAFLMKLVAPNHRVEAMLWPPLTIIFAVVCASFFVCRRRRLTFIIFNSYETERRRKKTKNKNAAATTSPSQQQQRSRREVVYTHTIP